MWLIAMQRFRLIKACMQSTANYSVASLFEEAQDIMKSTKHIGVCTEAINLLSNFILDQGT